MAIPMAFAPVGVTPLGVIPEGVIPDGVMPPLGVIPLGVMAEGVIPEGVVPPGVKLGVIPPGVTPPGVSSHRDRLLLAPGVGVSWMRSPPPRSVRGVSAHPGSWPGVSEAVQAHIMISQLKLMTMLIHKDKKSTDFLFCMSPEQLLLIYSETVHL